jgi:gamma-glutamyltranspeptidase/glutathione hydrolase
MLERRLRRALLAAALILAGATAAIAQGRIDPEPATGRGAREPVRAKRFMAAAANPHAVRAAVAILKSGGSAVDAAIAAQLVLNLVEPQSSGIGGGAFLLHWDAARRRLTSYDGRETAPKGINPRVFYKLAGSRGGFMRAVGSGASVGVPGLLRMLALAHKRHGKLPWARLFEPTIELSERGFAMSKRLHTLLKYYPKLARNDAARELYFALDGRPKLPGRRIVNRAFARTLRRIARGGADAFYKGPIARDIVAATRVGPGPPGAMTLADLAGYKALARAPVCGRYRGYKVCGMGPPSSGGTTVIQMLGLVERFDLRGPGPWSARAWHLLGQASALAFADRNRYLADPDFVRVPVRGLLDRGYIAKRSASITGLFVKGRAKPGSPPGARADRFGEGVTPELPATSHLSIVDADGNAVSMTTSIEHAFGSRRMVRGFLLNNQLTDFSFRGRRGGRTVANRIEGGKRPRSSMAPTMVFGADGKLVLVIGSPGGSRIIGYVAQRIVAVLDWRMDVQAAVSMGHALSRNRGIELERWTRAARMAGALRRLGNRVRVGDMNSGLHAIQILPDGSLLGGADPRREGIAAGE